jgi:uncharacterized protein (DUF488 family)
MAGSQKKVPFFTIGYEGLGIKRFLEILQQNGIRTVLDARHNPFSMNPDFRKSKLASHLEKKGIKYEHLKDYGIPDEVRKAGRPLEWYAENVKPKISASIIIEPFEQPVCFMCMEQDLSHCHRKVILDTLRQQGLDGRDLYPGA